MDAALYRAALFNGMTGPAFKFGTVLSLGWFWERLAGCRAVYRGQDGSIDYDNVAAVTEPVATEITIGSQFLAMGTTWHYVCRNVSDCGLESADSPAAVVAVETDGGMRGLTPNPPMNLSIETVAGGKLRLRWRYTPIGEEVSPTGFRIYIDSGSGFDFDDPLATVLYYLGGTGEFLWTSDALTNGHLYKFCVRSYRESLGPELVANGDFVHDKFWMWDPPYKTWAWLARKAKFTSTAYSQWGDLSQDISPIAGHTYRVTYTIVTVSGAEITARIGNRDGTTRTATGIYIEDIVAFQTAGGLDFYAEVGIPGDTAEIDDVSVMEVLAPDTESDNTDYISARADSEGPAAIDDLAATWSQI